MVKQNRVIRVHFKQLRKNAGTQEKVGRDIGVTGTTIRYIENGYVVPSGKLMSKLSKYFDKPVEELFPDVFATGNHK